MRNKGEKSTYDPFSSGTCPDSASPAEQRLRCGWLGFRPDFLQRFNNPKSLLVCLCLAALLQGMTQMGFVNVGLTTVEKRFNFKAKELGMIVGVFDVAFVVLCLPISYLASRPGASTPRWLGGGTLLMGLGSLVYAMPHFLSPPYRVSSSQLEQHDAEDSILCAKEDSLRSECHPFMDTTTSIHYRNMFLVGQMLHGVGSTPIYVMGAVFLDESVSREMSSLYIGVFSAMFVGGAALGFGVGSSILNIYVDWPYVDPASVGLTSSSNLWLGCWWLCFILAATMSVLVALLLLAFPSKIRSASKQSPKTHLKNHETQDQCQLSPVMIAEPTSFFAEIRKVCNNFPFMALTLAEAVPAFLATGTGAFMPKVIENQFGLSASTAALIVGISVVPAGCSGSFFGGWLLKKLNTDCAGAFKMCMWGSLLLVASSFVFLVQCDNQPFAGVNVAYDETTHPSVALHNLTAACNANCGCNGVAYNPVCGANNIIYYSPCHAGCSERHHVIGNEVFTNCSCFLTSNLYDLHDGLPQYTLVATQPLELLGDDPLTFLSAASRPSGGGSALRDKCPSDCTLMPLFLSIFVVFIFIASALSMPSVSAGLRCIDENQKTVAFGLRAQLSRLLGSIPGPIVFGTVIDWTCIQWQEGCEERGSCAVYELGDMSRSLLYLNMGGRVVGAVLYVIAWRSFVHGRPTMFYSRTEDSHAPGTANATGPPVGGSVPEDSLRTLATSLERSLISMSQLERQAAPNVVNQNRIIENI